MLAVECWDVLVNEDVDRCELAEENVTKKQYKLCESIGSTRLCIHMLILHVVPLFKSLLHTTQFCETV